MIYPSPEEIKSCRKENAGIRVIPVCKSVLADTDTPVSAWMKLRAGASSPYSFLLESADGDGEAARYSFLGADPYMIFSARGDSWTIRGAKEESGSGDPVGALRKLLAGYKHAPIKDMPRFRGGAVGYFSYDSVRILGDVPDKNPRSDDDPDDIFFGFYRDLIAFDNKKHRLLFISNIMSDDGADIENQYQDALARIEAMQKRMEAQTVSSRLSIESSGAARSNFEKGKFINAIDKCKEYINAGDISQIVLSQRFTASVNANPFDLYRALRIVNPSPYMFYFSLDKTHIIGASPEMLARVENGVIENRPIAGTRRRGENAQEDERLIAELKADPKEISEHIMLVDLGKDDLGKVCEDGSINVDGLMHIEKYSHVIHMVTNLSGKLRSGKDALDGLFACFPAGTLTGAPRVKAMEIIDELEPSRRGIYSGALGYIDFSGDMDMCIVIRTIIFKDGVVSIQAGAGVVADSVAEREYQETVEKSSAMLAAVNVKIKK